VREERGTRQALRLEKMIKLTAQKVCDSIWAVH
jgi:hypothetical protein